MALKKITEKPKITDTILFEITTPDSEGCADNPYKIDKVVVYFTERDFLGNNFGEYELVDNDKVVLEELKAAQLALCNDPTEENMLEVERIQEKLDASARRSTFYYKDREPVFILGNKDNPAWLSTTPEESRLTQSVDEDDTPIIGQYEFEWNPEGAVREGDYFICWTWTPNPAGESLSAHLPFKIIGDGRAVQTIPTHITPDEKYSTLLERYLPEMFKSMICDGDLTPTQLNRLNLAIADGFKFLEDQANQIIDLFDANVLHETMLVYLSNLFHHKLKSGDPTLWRRQIKEAVPLLKKKGTKEALEQAFSQAGMSLVNSTQYWQLVSPYTYQESFRVEDSPAFELTKENIVLPINSANFGLWIRREGTDDYLQYSKDHVSFETGEDCIVRMTWIGDQLSSNPVEIYEGDIIRVLYEFNAPADASEQAEEDYIRLLPLMDQRDEADQEYPPKNWNVRLIEEDDPLFDILIPVKHPWHEFLVFGKIRTEFPYSENIYNMEEYNGSTRDSYDVCAMDKDFIDPCGACISSVMSFDVEVEELSDNRISEAAEILNEFLPFHAQIFSVNYLGSVEEFVQSPVETIQAIIHIDTSEYVISGNANTIFTRTMTHDNVPELIPNLGQISEQTTVSSGKFGTGYNHQIQLVSPDVGLDDLGVIRLNHFVEVLAPHANAGTYRIDEIQDRVAKVVTNVPEPLDETMFTFNITNVLYGNDKTDITQDNLIVLDDENVDFALLGVKTLWDVENTPDYSGGSWKVEILAYSATAFEIDKIIDGKLHVKYDVALPTTDVSGVSYRLLTDLDEEVDTSTTGEMTVTARAYIDLNDTEFTEDNIHQFMDHGDYFYYDGVEYEIIEFDGVNFWISNYMDGDVGSANGVKIYRRLVEGATGLFGYRGLGLVTLFDHEAEFQMQGGQNIPIETDNNNFIQNYLFKVGSEWYRIEDIDGTNVTLAGPQNSWGTLDSGGTAVSYSIAHVEKLGVNVGFVPFDELDYDGHDVVIREILDQDAGTNTIEALSVGPVPTGPAIQEHVQQEEAISFQIEWANGNTEEGEV